MEQFLTGARPSEAWRPCPPGIPGSPAPGKRGCGSFRSISPNIFPAGLTASSGLSGNAKNLELKRQPLAPVFPRMRAWYRPSAIPNARRAAETGDHGEYTVHYLKFARTLCPRNRKCRVFLQAATSVVKPVEIQIFTQV
jgi:hypothetical protein